MIQRIHTVLSAAVTWLVVLAMVLTIVAAELADALGATSPVVVIALRAVAAIGVAVSIIRRVTPVLPDARGLLPKPDQPATSDEAWLTAELERVRSMTP